MQLIQEAQIQTASGVNIKVLSFGLTDYVDSYQAMLAHSQQRDKIETSSELDQIWLIQHLPVYTQGTACTHATLLPSDVPIVKTDRGGQITYHGPGQIVMYPLLHLKSYKLGVKALVANLEQAVIDLLAAHEIRGERREDAPGVYVNQAKIAALGLRIRRGSSYHGLSLNVEMDLSPFRNIDPCGYEGLEVTQLADLKPQMLPDFHALEQSLLESFVRLI